MLQGFSVVFFGGFQGDDCIVLYSLFPLAQQTTSWGEEAAAKEVFGVSGRNMEASDFPEREQQLIRRGKKESIYFLGAMMQKTHRILQVVVEG